MSNSGPLIHPTTVIFTPTSTVVGDCPNFPDSAYLKVLVLPTPDGKDIESVEVWYFNPLSEPNRLNEKIADEHVFKQLTRYLNGSYNTLIYGIADHMQRIIHPDHIAIIEKEYTKYISDGSLLDGFIAGIGAYLVFLLLNENGVFSNQMPFQFGVVYPVSSGITITGNMFEYLSLAFTALARSSQGILLQMILFIQTFINLWGSVFELGPEINPSHTARITMDVIDGFAQNVTKELVLARETTAELNKVEAKLKSHVDDELVKIRREINNIVAEARNAIKDLNMNSEAHRLDESIRRKVSQLTDGYLSEQIKNMIQMELEACHERIGEIVKSHLTGMVNTDGVLKNELLINECQGLEAIQDIESHNGQRYVGSTDNNLPESNATKNNKVDTEYVSGWIQPETNLKHPTFYKGSNEPKNDSDGAIRNNAVSTAGTRNFRRWGRIH